MKEIKTKRIASDIVKHVSRILLTDAKDMKFKNLTITAAEVSSDVTSAKVYFTCLKSEDDKQITNELNAASGFIRSKLASMMDLRHTPELNFVYDKSVEYGSNIERIIKEINSTDDN